MLTHEELQEDLRSSGNAILKRERYQPKSKFWKIQVAHEIDKPQLQILEALHIKTKNKKQKK